MARGSAHPGVDELAAEPADVQPLSREEEQAVDEAERGALAQPDPLARDDPRPVDEGAVAAHQVAYRPALGVRPSQRGVLRGDGRGAQPERASNETPPDFGQAPTH